MSVATLGNVDVKTGCVVISTNGVTVTVDIPELNGSLGALPVIFIEPIPVAVAGS